jgi:hypothetical protein
MTLILKIANILIQGEVKITVKFLLKNEKAKLI